MKLNIEDQIPIKVKVLYQCRILIPKDVQQRLKIVEGEELSLYATRKGIFLTKEGD